MKQIVDKLNKIAKAIDSDVTISNRKLIIDSLDSITTAFGGTKTNSKLIVDKLEDIANCVHGGGEDKRRKHILFNNAHLTSFTFGEGGVWGVIAPDTYVIAPAIYVEIDNVVSRLTAITGGDTYSSEGNIMYLDANDEPAMIVAKDYLGLGLFSGTLILMENDTEPTEHVINIYYYSEKEIGGQILYVSDPADSFYYTGQCLNGMAGEGTLGGYETQRVSGYSFPILSELVYSHKNIFAMSNIKGTINDTVYGGTFDLFNPIPLSGVTIKYNGNSTMYSNLVYIDMK